MNISYANFKDIEWTWSTKWTETKKKMKTSLESFFHLVSQSDRKQCTNVYVCQNKWERETESQMLQIDLSQINATALTYPFENQPF